MNDGYTNTIYGSVSQSVGHDPLVGTESTLSGSREIYV